MNEQESIQTILAHYPDVQAIYLFGSHGTDDEWADSDVDIALLLPYEAAKQNNYLSQTELQWELERLLGKQVDLINLRQAPTVFRKEIVMADRRIFCADQYAADEFEMLTISFYLKLNEERADILAEGLQSGSFYGV